MSFRIENPFQEGDRVRACMVDVALLKRPLPAQIINNVVELNSTGTVTETDGDGTTKVLWDATNEEWWVWNQCIRKIDV